MDALNSKMELQSWLLEEITSVESVFFNTLRNTQEVSILPTLRTQEDTPSPQEQETSSLLEKARSQSLHSFPN